jgi:hypothetical protein
MNATKSGGIFTFDHGQKKLNKAIGVEQVYLDDLTDQVKETMKNFLFDENREIKEDISPSQLVEIVASEYSYSQLVVMASFYLQDKLDGFATSLEKKMDDMKSAIKAIRLDADDIPPHIKEILDGLTGGESKSTALDGDSLPQELKDFLKNLAEEQEKQDGDGDDD